MYDVIVKTKEEPQMDADRRRWIVISIVCGWFFIEGAPPNFLNGVPGNSSAHACVGDWMARQETKRLQAGYDRIIHWGFANSVERFGYGFPRVNPKDIEDTGMRFNR
jgi:hypothetical protein